MPSPFEVETFSPEAGILSQAASLGHTLLEGAQGLRDTARSAGALGLSGVAALGGGGVAIAYNANSARGASLTPAACETEALQRPDNIKGVYQSTTDPNDHWYTETFSLPSVANCDSTGKRVVHYFQETNRDDGQWSLVSRTKDAGTGVITTKVVPKANSDIFAVDTNQAKKVHGFFRAPHFCVNEGPGLTNSDKRQGAKGRPTVEVTWEPSDGSAPVTKTFNGQAAKLCK